MTGAIACALVACAAVACAAPDVTPPSTPKAPPDAALVSVIPDDAPIDAAIDAPDPIDAADEPIDAAVAATPPQPEEWLKGSTHVHARPSGDSSTPLPDVIAWYEAHRYDFIVLTDHNRTTEVEQGTSLLVIPGIELTHNPGTCLPEGDKSGKCRIHVNLLGITGHVDGKLMWPQGKSRERLDKYIAALEEQKALGGIAQVNHPQWFWGMNGNLLAELGRRGFKLVEIANDAFAKWNKGDKDHPDMDTLWDAALVQGVTLWGVASDDAHDYAPSKKAKYPAGGGWVVVKAHRDPKAIIAALDAGHFYSSNGPVLSHAEVDSDALFVEVAAGERGSYTIDFIENGKRVERVKAKSARRTLPAKGYVRALVTRGDGTKAWVQPARR